MPKPHIELGGVVCAVLVCLLVLFQGGFYAGATCAFALLSAVTYAIAVALRKARVTCSRTTVLLGAIALLYLISSVAHGASATMLQETTTWFALAGMSLWCSFSSSRRQKARTLDALAVGGVILSALGILMYAGALPIEGTVSAGRLMFTFQYANTAGLFFAVIAVLCLCGQRGKRQIAAVVPVVALLLTQSGGAISVFLVAFVIIGARWVWREKPSRGLVIAAAIVFLGAIVAVVVVLQSRITQAAQTLIERVVQALDAFSLLSNNVLLGIGPDQWQFAYPSIQTAQYRAADVHCSYLQVALDAGVFALALLLLMVVLGVVGLVRRREFASALCACMIAAHALVDFDVQFAAMTLLFVLLVSEPCEEPANRVLGGRLRVVLCWIVVACAVFGSCVGIYLDARMVAVRSAIAEGEARQAESLVQSDACLRSDVGVRVEVAEALLGAGENEAVLEFTDNAPLANGGTALCRMLSLQRLGADDEARQTMSDALRAFSYDIELYKAVRQYIVENDLGEAYVQAFDEAARIANMLADTGRASWLMGQERIDLISG